MDDIRKTIERLDQLEEEALDKILDISKFVDIEDEDDDTKPGGWTVFIEATRDCIEPVAVEAVMYGANKTQDQAQAIVTASAWTKRAPVHTYAQRDVAESVAEKISNHAARNTRYAKHWGSPHWNLPTFVEPAESL